ncbi:Lar family restriction alleviation protein [Pseudomonas syringae]|uniref:Lar family restriction alleviation protein n=1 Tax=Pseudomonas syringae TaxID=317 RepID=UPI0018E628B5|nr:Lar family restriction alleviation protein [Pseudomonas syringae]MBI6749765.1 Lar family restriction alleviation protein [Pseudomonas syringae]MBI6771790.1 Lar family restriction alleviation protein [Pseudomonas syringae]MBI6775225.1 Lar family restriction alleviation protein [Pseudomonas syringae]MBI6793006.1 Lar family restriction alleviation protein [Pseudomonas syringae]MBI6800335.1 Lar family restriction alleviation protein [Pseudomonas syringae]
MNNMPDSTEMLPCPFCGQQDAFVEQLDSDASVVICQGLVGEHAACLARGPVGLREHEVEDQPGRNAAVREWNTRAQPADHKGGQMARMPVELCYDVRAKMIIAFNEAKKTGGDLDDQLDAAYKSALRFSTSPQ